MALEIVSSGAGVASDTGVKFSFGLGGQRAEVSVAGSVTDGNWHHVEVDYYNRVSKPWK